MIVGSTKTLLRVVIYTDCQITATTLEWAKYYAKMKPGKTKMLPCKWICACFLRRLGTSNWSLWDITRRQRRWLLVLWLTQCSEMKREWYAAELLHWKTTSLTSLTKGKGRLTKTYIDLVTNYTAWQYHLSEFLTRWRSGNALNFFFAVLFPSLY